MCKPDRLDLVILQYIDSLSIRNRYKNQLPKFLSQRFDIPTDLADDTLIWMIVHGFIVLEKNVYDIYGGLQGLGKETGDFRD